MGNTLSIEASENGDIELVQYLVAKEGDLNIQNESGNTALIKASECGYADIIKLLIAIPEYMLIL